MHVPESDEVQREDLVRHIDANMVSWSELVSFILGEDHYCPACFDTHPGRICPEISVGEASGV